MAKVFSSRTSAIALALVAALGLGWALLFSPGGRQSRLLARAARWKKDNRSGIRTAFAGHPRAGLMSCTDCRFYLRGEVATEEGKRDLYAAILALSPPMELINTLRVVSESQHGAEGASSP